MWWTKRSLESRIERLEAVSMPTPERTITITLLDSLESLQELPEEPKDWLTWPAAESQDWTASGLRVITLSAQDELQAREAVANE